MDIFDPINTIKYSCMCEKLFTLPELYYCNGCQKNACKFCVTEEIDSYYCPNCLENLASAEALLNQNRYNNDKLEIQFFFFLIKCADVRNATNAHCASVL